STVVVCQLPANGDEVSSAPRFGASTSTGTSALSLLDALAILTVTVPDTVAPDAGALMLTEGGVVSAFDTVTLTGDEVVRFPAAYLARADIGCPPMPTVRMSPET